LLELTGHEIKMNDILQLMFFFQEKSFPSIAAIHPKITHHNIAQHTRHAIPPYIPKHVLRSILITTTQSGNNIKIGQQINHQGSPSHKCIDHQPASTNRGVTVVIWTIVNAIQENSDEDYQFPLGFNWADQGQVCYQSEQELVAQVEQNYGTCRHGDVGEVAVEWVVQSTSEYN